MSNENLPTPEEIAEAISVMKRYVRNYRIVIERLDGSKFYDGYGVDFSNKEIAFAEMDTALAVLARCPRLVSVKDGEHVYTSRFKQGDRVFAIWHDRESGWEISRTSPFLGHTENGGLYMVDGEQLVAFVADLCFPTRAEAEAECVRRNEGK